MRALPPRRGARSVLPFIVALGATAARGCRGERVFRGYSQMARDARRRGRAPAAPFDFVLSPTVADRRPIAAELPSPDQRPGAAARAHRLHGAVQHVASSRRRRINCGYTRGGLPIGLQIVGQRFDDLGVLQVARAWEQMRPAPRPWPEPPRALNAGATDQRRMRDARGNPVSTTLGGGARRRRARAVANDVVLRHAARRPRRRASRADRGWPLPPLMKAGFLLSLTEPSLRRARRARLLDAAEPLLARGERARARPPRRVAHACAAGDWARRRRRLGRACCSSTRATRSRCSGRTCSTSTAATR